MQPETTRQLVRNIGNSALYRYLTPVSDRIALGYIPECCEPVANPLQFVDFSMQCVGLDCEMVDTDVGLQLCRVVVVNLKEEVLYDRWFDIREQTKIVDFVTHITGIDETVYQKEMAGRGCYDKASRQAVMVITQDKIIVGHDLANDIKMLGIRHQEFIDTVWLMPHHFGLPFKNKLKDLVYEYLHKHIQWGNHSPFEDSISALQIAYKHIIHGRGTIEIQPFPAKEYNNNYLKVLQDCQLDPQNVLMLVLRGSRALGIEVQHQYISDWDYIVVYDTQSQLDGRLIKLPNVDVTFFDKNSYARHMRENDISYLEAFFLPKECVYKNDIQFPEIEMGKLRASLGFHINKARMKVKRFQKEIGEKPYYRWKILKSYHLVLRFMDLFVQLFHFHEELEKIQQNHKENVKSQLLSKIDIKRMNNLWYQVQKQFKQNHNFETIVDKLLKLETQKYKIINQLYKIGKKLGYRHESGQPGGRNRDNKGFYGNCTKIAQSSEKIKQELASKLKTINFLRKNSVTELQDTYKIICKRHKIHPNLIQFHYLQSSNFSHPIPRQCRGLILNQSSNYAIVALPYYKFFDYNDPNYGQVKEVDWQSTRVYEKKDGSMAFLYFYEQRWNVASSTVPDGQNNYCFARRETTTQFQNQFWSIFYSLGFKVPSIQDKTKTFIFELMSRNHIIVVKREKNQLVLHGVRDIITLQEENHQPYGIKYGWNVTKPIQIPKEQMNIDDLVKRVEKLDPLQSQGYLVCDKNWTRLKIKNSSYVRINWLGQLNQGYNKDPKKYIFIEIILSGEAQTFCKYCPQWQELVASYLGKIKKLNVEVAEHYEPIKNLQRREFAENIKNLDKNIKAFLFAVKMNPQLYLGRVQTVMAPKNFYNFILNYK